jgi:hypothetical protein
LGKRNKKMGQQLTLLAKEIVPLAIILRALHWSMPWGRYLSPRVKISLATVEDVGMVQVTTHLNHVAPFKSQRT